MHNCRIQDKKCHFKQKRSGNPDLFCALIWAQRMPSQKQCCLHNTEKLLFFVVFAVVRRFAVLAGCNGDLRKFASPRFVVVFAHANVAKNGLLIFHFLHLLISLLSIASKKIHAFCTLILFLFDVVMQIFSTFFAPC